MVSSSEQNREAPEPLAGDEKCRQLTRGGDG